MNKGRFEQNFQSYLRNKTGADFEFWIDDYIKYIPFAEIYLADILHIKVKSLVRSNKIFVYFKYFQTRHSLGIFFSDCISFVPYFYKQNYGFLFSYKINVF